MVAYEPVDVPEPRTFTVTYIDNVTGDVIKVDTPVPEHGNSAVPTPPEHEGRTFKGWRKPDGTIVTELTVDGVEKIYRVLDCKVDDVVEFIPDNQAKKKK